MIRPAQAVIEFLDTHNVTEIAEHLAEHPEDRGIFRAMERRGKNRKGVLEATDWA